MKKYKNLITKDIALYFIILVFLLFFGISKIMPKAQDLIKSSTNIKKMKPKIEQLKEKKSKEEIAIQKANSRVDAQIPVELYTPPNKGLSAESASVELIDKIIWMIKETKNRVTEVAYEPSSLVDEGNPNLLNYYSIKLNFKLRGTYLTLQSLLQKIHTWDYLTEINKISIIPEEENKNNLIIDLDLELFVKL